MDYDKTSPQGQFNLSNLIIAADDNIKDFESNFEFKKALNKLENELQKKGYELTSLTKLYQDLKNLHNQVKKENNDLTNKLISVRNEMTNNDKKHQKELESIKSNFNNQKDIYEKKIKKLSEYNPNELRRNIEITTENKFKQELILKGQEIEQLTQEIEVQRQRNELLSIEYETFKSDMVNEMNTLKEFHKNEISNLLQQIQLSEDSKNIDNDNSGKANLNTLKSELDTTRHQLNELTNECDKLRHEKELLTIDKNDVKLELLKIRDSQNFTMKKLEAENERLVNMCENLKNEKVILNNTINGKDEMIKDLLNTRLNLSNKLKSYESEFQNYTAEIQTLRKELMEHDEEMNRNFLETDKEKKELIFTNKKDKENYQKQVEELLMQLKEAKTINKISDNKENSFFGIGEDYKNLSQRKDNEINKLKEKIKNLEKEAGLNENSKQYKDLLKKYNELKEKKNEYKLQCKLANENMETFIKKLNPAQQKEFMNIIQTNKNKYGIS